MISYGIPSYKGRSFTPAYTIIHHTAGTNSLNLCLYGRGAPNPLPGPLCQYLISKDGTVHHITEGYANHVGEAFPPFTNYNSVGIELENLGNGSDPYPEVQLEAARQLCRELGFPVFGHKEVCSPVGRKIDPSFSMDDFRASLLQEEPEVPLAPDEREALLGLRDAVLAPSNPDAGTAWSVAHIRNDFLGPRFNVPNALVALAESVSTLSAEVTSLGERLAALEARPSGGVEGSIDADALAEAVADKLAARLAN